MFCSQRPKRDFGVMCAVGCDGSSSSENEAESYKIWNALLAALVHYRVGEVLQPLLTEADMGKVALSCHFACDALCAELRRMRLTSPSLPTPSDDRCEGSPRWRNGAPTRRFCAPSVRQR